MLEFLDLGNLLVELDDFILQVFVAALLLVKFLVEIAMHNEPDRCPDYDHATEEGEELLLLMFAPDLAMRQQVNADHGSNLRIARPHATMREGASCVRLFGRIFEDRVMLKKGLAMMVLTWTRFVTVSSAPGIAAQPPDRTMW